MAFVTIMDPHIKGVDGPNPLWLSGVRWTRQICEVVCGAVVRMASDGPLDPAKGCLCRPPYGFRYTHGQRLVPARESNPGNQTGDGEDGPERRWLSTFFWARPLNSYSIPLTSSAVKRPTLSASLRMRTDTRLSYLTASTSRAALWLRRIAAARLRSSIPASAILM